MNKVRLCPREEMVLKYLKDKTKYITSKKNMIRYGGTKGITVKEGLDVLGTSEIRKSISILRKKGFNISDIWETGENRFGETTTYKRYFLLRKRS